MKILLTGSTGQLGNQISITKPEGVDLICLKRSSLDLTNFDSCFDVILKYKPDWVINAAAYTNVDKAESNRELTLATNSNSLIAFSKALNITGGKLLQISSDYVFNGNQNLPYKSSHAKSPINFYGYSKSQAEENIAKEFKRNKNYLILRTSWVMGPKYKNFLLTMLNLHKEKTEIKVVSDQIGALTSTLSLSNACWKIIQKYTKNNYQFKKCPILHFTNQGETSWYKIAVLVGEIASRYALISKSAEVIPILTSDFKTAAKRPKYSVLDCSQTYEILNYFPPNWKTSIEDIIKIIKANKVD